MEVRIELPPKLIPLFTTPGLRNLVAFGGRGSGKTRNFAKMTAVRALELDQTGARGIILCGREFMNSLDDSSMAEVKEAILSEPCLKERFIITEKTIKTISGNIEYKFAGLRYSLDAIKSKSRVHLLWIDEAENVSEGAWMKITPTVREANSQLWISYNPESDLSATHLRFRAKVPDNTMVVELNYRDNPWFPKVLEIERQNDLKYRPETYDHVWGGGFLDHVEGAYYASQLVDAKDEGRISDVAPDPLMTYRACWDIGGSGIKADATAIWITQNVGSSIRLLDYYEATSQPLEFHLTWLRDNGYDKCLCLLPHDGRSNDKVYDVSFESAIRQAGFPVEIIPNQGTGAALKRINEARRLFPSMWFNKDTTEHGRKMLENYHEKKHPLTKKGMGPMHDFSSHGSDAFGLMAVAHRPPSGASKNNSMNRKRAPSWMAA